MSLYVLCLPVGGERTEAYQPAERRAAWSGGDEVRPDAGQHGGKTAQVGPCFCFIFINQNTF